MSVPALSLDCYRSEHQSELAIYEEVLKSYWNRCLTRSGQSELVFFLNYLFSIDCNDSSEICCYIMLIAKIFNKEQFIVNTVEPNYHILFEAAIEMNMFHDMHRLLTRFNGTHLEPLKETILQFYDILLSCSHYNLFLKEEVGLRYL